MFFHQIIFIGENSTSGRCGVKCVQSFQFCGYADSASGICIWLYSVYGCDWIVNFVYLSLLNLWIQPSMLFNQSSFWHLDSYYCLCAIYLDKHFLIIRISICFNVLSLTGFLFSTRSFSFPVSQLISFSRLFYRTCRSE